MTRNMESGFYLREALRNLDGESEAEAGGQSRRSRPSSLPRALPSHTPAVFDAENQKELDDGQADIRQARVSSPKLKPGATMRIRLKRRAPGSCFPPMDK